MTPSVTWPDLHTHLDIKGPWGDEWLLSIVEDAEGGIARIAVPNAPGTADPVDVQAGDIITLKWTNHHGATEVKVRVRMVEREDKMLASCLVVPIDAPVVDQRRAYVRSDVRLPVTIVARVGDKPHRGWAINLSEGGLSCVVPGAVEAGDRPLVELDIDGEMLLAQTEVVRVREAEDGSTTFALKFVDLHRKDADRVRRYVFTAQLRHPARPR